MARVEIQDLPVKERQLNEKDMKKVFGGLALSYSTRALEPGCALCLGGINLPGSDVMRPEGGGEWMPSSTIVYR
ncbi:MAG: hypothetical protein ACOY46_04495 [Bacillota bacterium]